jgi:hypothetical protein
MKAFPHPRRAIRAPRVNLWGTVSATIQLQNGRQLWAKTLRISVTGGLLELATYLDERVSVQLTLHMGTRTIRSRAATLFPMCTTQGYQQPFRFVDLRDQARLALEAEIHEQLRQSTLAARPGLGLRPRQSFPESF